MFHRLPDRLRSNSHSSWYVCTLIYTPAPSCCRPVTPSDTGIGWALQGPKSLETGAEGFEPPTTWSEARHSVQAELSALVGVSVPAGLVLFFAAPPTLRGSSIPRRRIPSRRSGRFGTALRSSRRHGATPSRRDSGRDRTGRPAAGAGKRAEEADRDDHEDHPEQREHEVINEGDTRHGSYSAVSTVINGFPLPVGGYRGGPPAGPGGPPESAGFSPAGRHPVAWRPHARRSPGGCWS